MSHEREMSDKDYAELWKPHENLRKQLAAAEALAAKWERIALASPRVEYGWDDTAKSYAYFIYDNPNTERPRLVAKGATRSEALLAWFDQQKGA